jgi:GT2 family glycosyltransferase
VEYGIPPELTIVTPTIDVFSDRMRRCMSAVRAHTDVPYETVIVENRSPPQGFTDPVNAGIRASHGSYVVVLADDVEVHEGWWPPLRQALDDGALVSYPDYFPKGFPRSELFMSACLALSRDAIEECGYAPGTFFDPRFKVCFQDSDLLLRLCELERPPVEVKESRIDHKLSLTVRAKDPEITGSAELMAWIAEREAKDKEMFIEKWSGGRKGPRAMSIIQPYLEKTA